MNHEVDDDKQNHQSKRRKLLGLLGLSLLAGCDNMFGKDKKKLTMDPEHGKEIERNGQKFTVYVVAGERFVVPVFLQSGYILSGPADSDGVAGFDLHLLWPDIPPNKAPETKFIESTPDRVGNRTRNQIEVQVHEDTIVRSGDAYQASVQSGSWASPDYIVRDDLALGLRFFIHKNATQAQIEDGLFNVAYSLTEDARTPYYHEPVVVGGDSIAFAYTKNIHIRIIMMGWNRRINPNWKGIYLGVIETLSNYREDKK